MKPPGLRALLGRSQARQRRGTDASCLIVGHPYSLSGHSRALSQIFIGGDLWYGLSSHSQYQEKESDDGGELQGGPFPQGYYPDGCALVRRVSLELSAYRRTDGGARGRGRSLHSPALGGQIQPPLGRGVPSAQASSVGELADG